MMPSNQNDRQAKISRTSFALRTIWIFLQAGAAYLLAEQVSPFFYQQF